MGLFDSLKDAMRPDDDPNTATDSHAADAAKHADRSVPPKGIQDPAEPEESSGGKHARRD
jgi:hypothetical protein